ncbi:AAA family ATPase [Pseudomonas brassicacearum]|uniref:AAA family ATPase n=1 Tax=Pseudomonas brassicacearum TaxID=930166 RepID=UPI0011CD369A|nr:AAA family ATPase [Pseudomonas brassicacearum]
MNNPIYSYNGIPLIIPERYNPEENSFTILVGNNGVGKSRLLSGLSSELIEKYNLDLRYQEQLYTSYYAEMPKIITVSTSPFDTFKLPQRSGERYKADTSNYRYIGMRGNGLLGSGSISLISSAATGLLDKLRNQQNFYRLAKIFEVLGFDPSLEFIFKPMFDVSKSPRNKKPLPEKIELLTPTFQLFLDQKTESTSSSFLESIKNFKSETTRYTLPQAIRQPKYSTLTTSVNRSYTSEVHNTEVKIGAALDPKIQNSITSLPDSALEEIETAIEAYSRFYIGKSNFRLRASYDSVWNYRFDFGYGQHDILLNAVRVLLQYGLIKLMDLKLSKPSNPDMSLRRASSGEQCMLVIMLGIAGHITDFSKIFIDEPEISLHPQWQEKFMELLIEVFSSYRGCNFFIATHSPQTISRLHNENCFITSLTKGEIYNATDFRARSADFQLAELFDAPGIKNEYLIRLAFGIMSRVKKNKKTTNEDISELNKLIKLSKKTDSDDPLLELISSVFEMINFYAAN